MTDALAGKALVKVGGQLRERDLAEAGEEERFGFVKHFAERSIDRLFDEAAGRISAVANGKKGRTPKRIIDVAQGDAAHVAGDGPATTMTLFRPDIAVVTEAAHDAANDDRVGRHRLGEHVRCDRALVLGHVEKDVQDAR